jgi:adenylate cyclase
MEVERKFRLHQAPDLAGSHSDPIEQGYLAVGAEGEVRLRRKGEQTLITAKQGAGLSRGEAEVEISPEQFEALWPLTEGRRLRKRRHLLPHDGLEVEVDVYEGELEGLVVAEVEFDSEEQARGFEAPAWLGEDVTGDDRFLNETLAVNGAPDA